MSELDKLKEELIALTEKVDTYECFPEFWEPTSGEQYWYLDEDTGYVAKQTYVHTKTKLYGNCYKTQELAKEAKELQFAIQRLKKAIWKLNEGISYPFIIGERNYCVVLFEGEVETRHCTHTKMVPDWMYLCNLRAVSELIGTHKDDLLLYLGQ